MPYQQIKFYQAGSFVVGNRLLDARSALVQARMERSNTLTSGHRACQGCGEALGARYVLDAAMRATQGKLIAANATGCLEVFSTPFPESAWQLPWIHSLFGNAPGGGDGHRGGDEGEGPRGRARGRPGRRRRHLDIGFACLSGMFERDDDVLYVCYDNEAYMNTGVQRSGATPPARPHRHDQAGRATSPATSFGQGKNAPLIAMAHEIPYVATATVAELRDLEYKVERAMEFRGARYLHVFVPCPLGWGSASHDTIRIARLAKETGLFPVFEAEHGEWSACRRSAAACRSRSTSRSSAASRTCSATERASRGGRADPGDGRPQHPALRAARRRGRRRQTSPVAPPTAADGTPLMRTARPRPSGGRSDGEALRDHPRRRLEPRQQDRQLAHRARRVRRPHAAVQPRLPGRREHPAVALPRRGGRGGLRARLAADHGGQPVPGHHGTGLLPPVRDRLQPRAARRGGGDQLGRALPGRRGDRAGLDGRGRGRALRQARAGGGRRALRAVRRLPPRPPRPRGDDPRRRADDRRHDALRHPEVPAAARGARRRGRSASSTWA